MRLRQGMRLPKYRHWKTRNLGFSDWRGERRYWPGSYGSEESLAAYEDWLEELKRLAVLEEAPSDLTLAELMEPYLDHCSTYYGTGSRTTTAAIKLALCHVVPEWGLIAGAEFSPRVLKAIREEMIKQGLARTTINGRIGKIKGWVKWLVSEGLVAPEVWHGLQSVPSLKKGRTAAPDPEPRGPVAWRDAEPVLQEVSHVVAAMLMLQWYTGARSGSICRATPAQFSEDPQEPRLLLWRPEHKAEHLGKELILPIGPRAQQEVAEFLEHEPYCFDPREATNRGRPGRVYTPWTYRRALVRGQAKCQEKAREAIREGKVAYVIQRWTPHQLRHARGHEVRERWGVEAAQAILGHDSLASTQVYSDRQLGLARRIALEEG